MRLPLLAALLLLLPAAARAQVGHPPSASPYRDIAKGHSFQALGGYTFGGVGEFGVNPRNGATFGIRYELRASNLVSLGGTILRGELERFIRDPELPQDDPAAGPVQQTVTMFDVGLQFNVTGAKSWNRLAPFFGLGMGLAIGADTPGDPSTYEFGNKFYIVPAVGVRVFASDRLFLRAEGRGLFWKQKYPAAFLDDPLDPETGLPVDQPEEWLLTPQLQVGLGYTVSF